MATFIEAAGDAIRQSYCALTSTPEALAGLAQPLLDGLPSNPGTDLVGNALQQARQNRNAICGDPFDDGTAGAPPPFTGGQCPGTIYTVMGQATLNGSNFGGVQTGTGPGPISKVTVTNPEGTFRAVNVIDANGDILVGIGSGIQNDIDVINITATPAPGEPNDCGDPARDVPEYNENNFTFSPTIVYDDGDGGPSVTINPTGIFAPISVDMNNNFRIPVRLTVAPNIPIDLNFDLSTGETTINNTNVFEPTVPTEPFEVSPEDFDEDDERLIIGVRLTSTIGTGGAAATQISQAGGSFSLNVPRLGNVYFTYASEGGGIVRSQEFPYKQLDQVIFAPRACEGVVVSPEDNVTTGFVYIVVTAQPVETYW